MPSIDSIDKMIEYSQTYGGINRTITASIASTTTAATTTSGYTSWQRFPQVYTMPSSFGSGVSAAYMTYARATHSIASASIVPCLEYDLGTLTVSGNSFASGVSMPTKTVSGSSLVSASILPMIFVSTSLGGATNPVLTITYTNQAGTGSRSASMTLPTNPLANSCFLIIPHLQSGDMGIRAVTNLSISTGTSGVLIAKGLLPLAVCNASTAPCAMTVDPLNDPWPMIPITTSEKIALYGVGTNTPVCSFTFYLLPSN